MWPSGGYSRWVHSEESPPPAEELFRLKLKSSAERTTRLRFSSCATGETEKCNLRPPFAQLERPLHKVRLVREPISYQFMHVGGNDAWPGSTNGIEWDDAVQWDSRIPRRHESNLQ